MRTVAIHDGHNASVAVVEDGRVVAACQEERLTRVKNQGGTPVHALSEVLRLSGTDSFDLVERVILSGKVSQPPYVAREDVLRDYDRMSRYAQSRLGRLQAVFSDNAGLRRLWEVFHSDGLVAQTQELRKERLIETGIPREKITFVDHHSAHAASAYYGLANYGDQILVLTNDGAGDGICATVNLGHGGKLERLCAVTEDYSLATIYAMITYLMGMVPLEHEYKIMGLAPYCRGSLDLNPVYTGLCELFEWDPRNALKWRRRAGVPRVGHLWEHLERLLMRKRFDTVAAGLQAFTETFLVEWVRRCVHETGVSRVAVSGGIFMNVKANQAILSLPEVDELFVFPSCGDETNSIGAAYWYYAEQNIRAHQPMEIPPLGAIYWGGDYLDDEIETTLREYGFTSSDVRWQDYDDIELQAADLLARGKVVARFKGRMEFGARALGNRSILANASQPNVVQCINNMIKARDFWMPFAPSILAERSSDYLYKPKPVRAAYMTMSFDTVEKNREHLVAAIHREDGTARPHEVFPGDNPEYESLLKHYQEITGMGAILNTSFNLHGYPLVYSPRCD